MRRRMDHCLLAFGLLVQLAGCAHAPVAAATRSARDNEDALAADLANHCRQHRLGDALVILTMSLDALPLASAKQAQVARLEVDLLEKMRPARQARHQLLRALADGLAAPTMDRAKVDAAMAHLVAASAALRDVALDALNQLHHLLAPAEREALAQELIAHEAPWPGCNVSEHGQLLRITAQLALTPRQRDQLKQGARPRGASASAPTLAEATPARQFEAAFRSEDFEAKSPLLSAEANLDIQAWETFVWFCEHADPMLSDQQRCQLGRLIRRLEQIYDTGELRE
jgi:hypothetical protein